MSRSPEYEERVNEIKQDVGRPVSVRRMQGRTRAGLQEIYCQKMAQSADWLLIDDQRVAQVVLKFAEAKAIHTASATGVQDTTFLTKRTLASPSLR